MMTIIIAAFLFTAPTIVGIVAWRSLRNDHITAVAYAHHR